VSEATTTRILFAGESWSSYGFHVKGASAYTTASYEEGAEDLIAALEEGGAEVTYMPNHRAVERFPFELDEVRERFDVVILSDLPSDSLLLPHAVFTGGERRPNRLSMLCEFVRQGGGLLMIGGYMSFAGYDGKARYGATPLREVLPVVVADHDDRMEVPEGVVPRAGEPHEVTSGLPGSWPYFLGYNRAAPASDAAVLLWAGDDPLLAVREVGAGRTAAFTSDCAPHWGSPQFMAWEGYAPFWNSLTGWLAAAPR
jgi:uncharacterized membrane protein